MNKIFKTAATIASFGTFISLSQPPKDLPKQLFYYKKLENFELKNQSYFSNISIAFEELINIRKRNGLSTDFILDSTFCAVAQKFANQLADSTYPIGHNPPFNKFEERTLYLSKFRCNLAEAIGFCYNLNLDNTSIIYLVNSLLNSKPHKDILLKQFVKYVGIGIGYNKENEKLVVVIIIGY